MDTDEQVIEDGSITHDSINTDWLKTKCYSAKCYNCRSRLIFENVEIHFDPERISVDCFDCGEKRTFDADFKQKKIFKWRPKPVSKIRDYDVIKINMYEKDSGLNKDK